MCFLFSSRGGREWWCIFIRVLPTFTYLALSWIFLVFDASGPHVHGHIGHGPSDLTAESRIVLSDCPCGHKVYVCHRDWELCADLLRSSLGSKCPYKGRALINEAFVAYEIHHVAS